MEKQMANYEGEIIKLGSELNQTKLQLDAQEKENEILKSKLAEANSELESRRKVAHDVDLKQAELGIKLVEVNKEKENFAMKIAAVSLINTKLNIREGTLAPQRAELEATQTHFDLLLQEERRRIRAEIEAELDASFKAVEPFEKMMAAVVRREASVKEREKQCKYLLEEISERTAEIVLTQEHTFAKRAEGMLHSVYNEFFTLRHAIAGKALVTIPSGSLNDAKKGKSKGESKGVGGSEVMKTGEKEGVEEDDEARAEEARRKGKQVAVFQEKRKPQSGKLLASSLAAHTASAAHVEMEQNFELREKGIT